MELKIHNGELVKRGPVWYIFFISLMIFLILYSFFKGSLMGALSVAFIFLLLVVVYIISYLVTLKKTTLIVQDNYLIVGGDTFSFDQLLGFNVEFDDKGHYTNFVLSFVNGNLPLKFTIIDSEENVKKIISYLLERGLPVYNNYEQDKFYKLINFLKL